MFGLFKPKPPADVIKNELQRLAPTLFPGGHQQITDTGEAISTLLNGKIPPESAAKLFASTKYLAHTAADKSRERIVAYMVRQAMGLLSEQDAGQVYDLYISEDGGAAGIRMWL
ncbi:hypothetical protein WKW79_31855 [Variovorax robiniae]|uniref:Uncharacterized protein n=1 Tax=Variovorax robiniae TaxID=1836199 RepID=A0ABU8XHI4_9BURK